MAEDIQIQGLSELLRAMKELPKAIETKCLRIGVAAGAQVIRKAAQDLVVRKTGLIAKAIRIGFNRKESTPGKVVYHIFVSRKVKDKVNKVTRDAFYWRFIEFGTIKMAAKPFMRPAFDTTNKEAISVIKGKLTERIEIEAARLGKG
jgi:HK97 gp10 family phage protein